MGSLGKALSFISPVAGAITGDGIGKVLPYLSPAYGLISGKGPFNDLLGGLFGQAQQSTSQTPSTPTDPSAPSPAPTSSPPTSSPASAQAIDLGSNEYLAKLLAHLLSRR